MNRMNDFVQKRIGKRLIVLALRQSNNLPYDVRVAELASKVKALWNFNPKGCVADSNLCRKVRIRVVVSRD